MTQATPIPTPAPDEPAPSQTARNTCRSCGGSGRAAGQPCPECQGSGTVPVTVGDA
jgi:DnaJ-class molecular chaperone